MAIRRPKDPVSSVREKAHDSLGESQGSPKPDSAVVEHLPHAPEAPGPSPIHMKIENLCPLKESNHSPRAKSSSGPAAGPPSNLPDIPEERKVLTILDGAVLPYDNTSSPQRITDDTWSPSGISAFEDARSYLGTTKKGAHVPYGCFEHGESCCMFLHRFPELIVSYSDSCQRLALLEQCSKMGSQRYSDTSCQPFYEYSKQAVILSGEVVSALASQQRLAEAESLSRKVISFLTQVESTRCNGVSTISRYHERAVTKLATMLEDNGEILAAIEVYEEWCGNLTETGMASLRTKERWPQLKRRRCVCRSCTLGFVSSSTASMRRQGYFRVSRLCTVR